MYISSSLLSVFVLDSVCLALALNILLNKYVFNSRITLKIKF